MFHARDGLYFKRMPDGSVLIRFDVQLIGKPLVRVERRVDADTWASAVASVSPWGDNAVTFQAACELHGPFEQAAEKAAA